MGETATAVRGTGTAVLFATLTIFADTGVALTVSATLATISRAIAAILSEVLLAIAIATAIATVIGAVLTGLIRRTFPITTDGESLAIAALRRGIGADSIPLVIAAVGIIWTDIGFTTLIVASRSSIGCTAIACA